MDAALKWMEEQSFMESYVARWMGAVVDRTIKESVHALFKDEEELGFRIRNIVFRAALDGAKAGIVEAIEEINKKEQ